MDRNETHIHALLIARLRNIILGVFLLIFIAGCTWLVIIPSAKGVVNKESTILYLVFEAILFVLICLTILSVKHTMSITSKNKVEICWRILWYKIQKREFEKKELTLSSKQNQERYYVVRIEKDKTILFEQIIPDKKTSEEVYNWLQTF